MAKVYRCDVRVPYADVDQMGVVYYANYLVYFEMARNALLREAGMPYTQMEQDGVMLPVVEAHCEYHLPAKYDDLITVCSACLPFDGVRLRIQYEVYREDTRLMTGYTHHVCMSPQGKVLRPTAALQQLAVAV
ncbi:MAG: acyl-CoA thioesterase [Kiritimatiellia bacterium]